MKIGIFTGTFDPFTIGHQNIAERALPMFDKLVIAVAVSKLKHASEEISKRVEDIKAVFPKECSELVDAEDASKGYRLEVVSYDDLTIDLAHRMGARFLVRGVRSAKDFEYEREQADINKQLGGVETILLFSDPRYSSISSTLVRELRFFGREVDEFLLIWWMATICLCSSAPRTSIIRRVSMRKHVRFSLRVSTVNSTSLWLVLFLLTQES